ncbi:hypothetical protein OPKNFCMD_4960 [Methylobacterium crusticola]|uniref:DUF3325 domain-containing protein n=1 Tax=Methylobacterium crusticola TaxID=1697972 RepID=A0ABQ4R3J4_9HYPH|nr:DUF3325 domain-containing protein [Methylobacterium crusticola]GJD52198.1 hypothetical protein OPKNFCMD_4960 [Methylobacterium crusticola]
MNAGALLLNLGLSFLGLGALCLSLARHHGAVLRSSPRPARVLALRAAGWSLIGLSLAAAIRLEGGSFGPVQWLGSLVGAGLVLIAALSYRPRALPWMLLLAAAASLAAPALAMSRPAF